MFEQMKGRGNKLGLTVFIVTRQPFACSAIQRTVSAASGSPNCTSLCCMLTGEAAVAAEDAHAGMLITPIARTVRVIGAPEESRSILNPNMLGALEP